MKNVDNASAIVADAYQMYTGKPHDLQKEPFAMYSFDRPAAMFWSAVAGHMLDNGKTEAEVREWFVSKDPRWMLDHYDDEIYSLGKAMAQKYMSESND